MTGYDSEELAEAAIKVIIDQGGVDTFDGQNCDDFDQVCLGWDGESRRCSCGNRRVTWNVFEMNGKWYFNAEAW